MSTFVGEVAVVNARSGKSKKGKPYTSYSFKLKLDGGDETGWISAGFDEPSFAKGDYIKVETGENDRGYEELERYAEAKRPVPVASSTGSVAGNGVHVSAPSADRQGSIIWQHSQEMAIAEVDLLHRLGALPLSAATSKAGIAKRYEEVTKAIQKRARALYEDAATLRLVEAVADEGELDFEADAGIPEAYSAAAVGADD